MQTTRRGFFGVLGAAPMLAQEAKAKTLELVERSHIQGHSAGTLSQSPIALEEHAPEVIRDLRLRLKMFDDVEAETRRNAARRWQRRTPQLDPDIAGMHSMSVSARYDMQRKRMVDREVDEARASLSEQLENVLAGRDRYFGF